MATPGRHRQALTARVAERGSGRRGWALVLIVLITLAVAALTTSAGAGFQASTTSLGISEPTLAPDTVTLRRGVRVDSANRSYEIIAPAHEAGPLPAIVMLHGSEVTSADEELRSGLLPYASTGKAVLIFPDAYHDAWNAGGGCCGLAGKHGIDDVGFLHALLADLRSHLPVQPRRIYLGGYSNGAKLAFAVACAHPVDFTGIAVYGGYPLQRCTSSGPHPVPMMIAMGSADPEMATKDPPSTAPQHLATLGHAWHNRDGCRGAPSQTSIGMAVLRTWQRCSDDSRVQTVQYDGVNHSWPAPHKMGYDYFTVVGREAAMATLMWRFFSSVPR
ncbi:MAG: alpha/beta hydrolase family esterase [Sciscionella sp.]